MSASLCLVKMLESLVAYFGLRTAYTICSERNASSIHLFRKAGIIGAAIGMALYGLRPVPEIQFADFIFPAFDQIVNELAKFRYRSGGQYPCPVVIRTPYGGGIRGGHYHSQSPEALFVHTAGLKVVIPSNPYDAKGLLLSAMRQNDPVLFMEPKRMYRAARERSSRRRLHSTPRKGTGCL